MWLFAMFDLPVTTKQARRLYARFRKVLLREGFSMLQFSVYARYFPSEETANVNKSRIRAQLPPKGQVRLLAVTDKQFGKMEVFHGEKPAATEKPTPQLLLF
jgi:CRISPR-associated protein Cas2